LKPQQAGTTVYRGDSGQSWMTETLQTTWHSCHQLLADAGQDHSPGGNNIIRERAQIKINRKKTKLIKINATANKPTPVGGEPISEVEFYVYLESVVDKQGDTDRHNSKDWQCKRGFCYVEEHIMGFQTNQHEDKN
jgi:hypothetical protein